MKRHVTMLCDLDLVRGERLHRTIPSAEQESKMHTTSGKPMRAAIYHRVSTTDQDANAARHELQQAAAARGFVVTMDVAETGSGARNDRPGLRQVMDGARKHKIDAVLVWKLDRFGRSTLDLLSNIQELQRCGVRFIATSQGLDIGTKGDPMSNLMLTILAGVADFERHVIIERTPLGLEKAKRDGKQLGRRLRADAPDPAQVAGLRANGTSWSAVAKKLGCDVDAARRAFKRLGSKGPGSGVAVPVDNAGLAAAL